VLESFIAQFYDDKPVPRLILLSHQVETQDLLAEALSTKAERKVEIRVPERGAKTGLVAHALQNAKEALARKLVESASQARLLEGVAERFGLPRVPQRVEVYDNSHIMGTNAVGAMVVAGPDGFQKSQYRKFNIKSDAGASGDDYGMMREVLTRRFKRLKDETRATREATQGALPATVSTNDPGIPSPRLRGEGEAGVRAEASHTVAGEGRPQAAAPFLNSPAHDLSDSAPHPVSAPHPDPLPVEVQTTGRGSSSAPASQADRAVGAGSNATRAEPAPVEGPSDSEEQPVSQNRPDLVLIDGGQGQLQVAREVMAELGLTDIPLIGVAKGPDRDAGREHFHIPGRDRPMMLEPRDPVLYFVQRLRDEAHRFAIGAHRAKRAKALGVNPLDEIEGIGPTRKRALLSHFGSAKSVSRAGIEDLKSVPGISAEMAQKIYDFFNERRV